MNLDQFESRKKSHLDLALDRSVQAQDRSGLDRVELLHDALPELDFDQIDLSLPFLGRKLKTPLFISGMTAGHAAANIVNERLSQACAKRGWIFGVGSQRRELDSSLPVIDSWSGFKNPELCILGNLGLSQAIQADVKSLKKIAKRLEADAFCIHLNALQEALQPEGTPQFKGGVKALRSLTAQLGIPIVLKETGCGFSEKSLSKIKTLRLAAVDVSGLGGTHWGRIEGKRAASSGDSIRAGAAETFSDWGVSTVDSVRSARKILPKKTEVWASGGVRSGLDAAKLLALGASRVGFAKPALEAALLSEKDLDAWMSRVEFELKLALFSSGYESVKTITRDAVKNGDVVYV